MVDSWLREYCECSEWKKFPLFWAKSRFFSTSVPLSWIARSTPMHYRQLADLSMHAVRCSVSSSPALHQSHARVPCSRPWGRQPLWVGDVRGKTTAKGKSVWCSQFSRWVVVRSGRADILKSSWGTVGSHLASVQFVWMICVCMYIMWAHITMELFWLSLSQ